MNKKILYINIRYLLLTYCNLDNIDEDTYNILKGRLQRFNLEQKSLIVFDMENVKFSSITLIDENQPKKSVLYFVFKDIIEKNHAIDFLFINTTEDIGSYLIERDFNNKVNVFVLYFFSERYFKNGTKQVSLRQTLNEKWCFLDNLSFLDKEYDLRLFVDEIVSTKIENFILAKACVTSTEKNNHKLNSTPVHVNKYVNLKPILEDFELFSETCYLLSKLIISKFRVPDYIVGASKNAVSIASGLLRYIKTADLIIINQISPITKLNNYSNIASIKSNASYAIVEDFHCMGTEVKIVKGILWSHGVNVEENVYTFPIACTKIYDKDYEGGYKKQKIYPMYKLGEQFKYKMFTHNSCPVCNELKCDHRELFSF